MTKFPKQHIDAVGSQKVKPMAMNDSITQSLVSYMELVTAHTLQESNAPVSTHFDKKEKKDTDYDRPTRLNRKADDRSNSHPYIGVPSADCCSPLPLLDTHAQLAFVEAVVQSTPLPVPLLDSMGHSCGAAIGHSCATGLCGGRGPVNSLVAHVGNHLVEHRYVTLSQRLWRAVESESNR
eukprot:GHVS01077254.1.p1 GENE.GHVS01077254.1~~GHVS01077254.1.p1  ORF type:complete len:180 (-),score=9.32 GHVS01077254.1:708-1247(-)